MAVRDALLALLTVGPAYGFQLHGGLATRTGGRRSVNVGQTYATLERLAKQGLVESAGTTDDGLPLHRLTAAGVDAARGWLDGTDAAGSDPWDETVDRVLVAHSLPGFDADTVIAGERERWTMRRAAASDRARPPGEIGPMPVVGGRDPDDADTADVAERAQPPERQLARLAASAEVERADAALAWLVTAASTTDLAIDLSAARPKRGRRPAAAAAAAPQSIDA